MDEWMYCRWMRWSERQISMEMDKLTTRNSSPWWPRNKMWIESEKIHGLKWRRVRDGKMYYIYLSLPFFTIHYPFLYISLIAFTSRLSLAIRFSSLSRHAPPTIPFLAPALPPPPPPLSPWDPPSIIDYISTYRIFCIRSRRPLSFQYDATCTQILSTRLINQYSLFSCPFRDPNRFE